MGILDQMKYTKMARQAVNAHQKAGELAGQGRLSEANVQYEEAMRLYNAGYEAGCRKNGFMMSYSVLMMRFGNFERARELMREMSADKTMDEDIHFELRMNYSICLWRLGLLDEAIKTAQYAGKHLKNSTYYTSLCTYLVEKAGQTGEFDEAQKLLDEAMDYDDEDAATLDSYGEFYRLKSERAEGEQAAQYRAKSIDLYERALKAKPGQITTLYAMAKYSLENGNRARAKELIDKAILRSNSHICPISKEMLQALRAEIG